MHPFAATTESQAVVPVARDAVWAVLRDPDVLPVLTPLLRRIVADGDLWRWEMARIGVLGVATTPSFTERMTFVEPHHIGFTHAPPAGTSEISGAEGTYDLSETADGTELRIRLTFTVELPLSRLAAPAVTGVMRAAMARTGDRFATNLLRHLGVPG